MECITLKVVRCEWDGDKADRNARKHGVTFEEAATVFSDPRALIIEDERHPENARIIGESLAARILLVGLRRARPRCREVDQRAARDVAREETP